MVLSAIDIPLFLAILAAVYPGSFPTAFELNIPGVSDFNNGAHHSLEGQHLLFCGEP